MVGSPEHRPCIPGHFWVRTGRRFWAPTDTRSLICDQHCFFVSFDRLLGQSSVRSLLTTLHAERHFLGLTSNFRDAFLVDSRQFGKLGALTGIHLLVGGAGWTVPPKTRFPKYFWPLTLHTIVLVLFHKIFWPLRASDDCIPWASQDFLVSQSFKPPMVFAWFRGFAGLPKPLSKPKQTEEGIGESRKACETNQIQWYRPLRNQKNLGIQANTTHWES